MKVISLIFTGILGFSKSTGKGIEYAKLIHNLKFPVNGKYANCGYQVSDLESYESQMIGGTKFFHRYVSFGITSEKQNDTCPRQNCFGKVKDSTLISGFGTKNSDSFGHSRVLNSKGKVGSLKTKRWTTLNRKLKNTFVILIKS